ncbi:MAG: class I SAM-dependent methyltransferase [Firmicutes bacterium]|nr:class I SAM-dependent methyltransferase [Bacillota bacterium]
MLAAEAGNFYDEYPFDWTERYRPAELATVISPVLIRLLDRLAPNAFVLDVGCGPGRVMTYLAYRQIRALGVDRSFASVVLMQQRCQLPGIVADNLALPLAGGTADLVISDGVLHHTEDPALAFAELCRMLRPGGLLFLAVYRPGGHYEWLYHFPGSVFRRAVRHRLTRALVHATALPLYYLVHVLRSPRKRSWRGARNLFYDYFVTPRVHFLRRDTIEQWCRRCGVRLVEFHPRPIGNVQAFVIEKQ